jgi:hypothetical protein
MKVRLGMKVFVRGELGRFKARLVYVGKLTPFTGRTTEAAAKESAPGRECRHFTLTDRNLAA